MENNDNIKLCVTGLSEGNSPVTGEFTTQGASSEEMFPFDYVIMADWNEVVCVVN